MTLFKSHSGVVQADVEAPVGGIIAVGGSFTAADNGGSFSQVGVSVGAGWKKCDGTVISGGIPALNGRFVAKLDDGRFLRGHSTPGTPGGSASHTIVSADLPTHTHTIAHIHDFTGDQLAVHDHAMQAQFGDAGTSSTGIGAFNGSGTYNANFPNVVDSVQITAGTPSGTIGNSSNGDSGNGGFANNAINHEPVYLTCDYYMRIF